MWLGDLTSRGRTTKLSANLNAKKPFGKFLKVVEISKNPTPSRGSLGLLNQTLNPWGEAFWETLSRSLFLYLIAKIRGGGVHSEILQVWKHPAKTNMEPPLKLVGLYIDVYFLFQLNRVFSGSCIGSGGGRSVTQTFPRDLPPEAFM